jgi:hypothetical protein
MKKGKLLFTIEGQGERRVNRIQAKHWGCFKVGDLVKHLGMGMGVVLKLSKYKNPSIYFFEENKVICIQYGSIDWYDLQILAKK